MAIFRIYVRFLGCIFLAILMSLPSGKVPLIVNENSFIQMGATSKSFKYRYTNTKIGFSYPESDAHIKKIISPKWMLWLDGRLMVQEAVQMPHTELHGMDEAKARKAGNKSDGRHR